MLVRAGDDHHPESAYIYGRFRLDPESGGATAFSIRCRDGKRYKIVFSKDKQDALRMIRLPAGTCQLEDVITKAVGSYREMAPFRLPRNNYAATTAEMKRAYPGFASAVTSDRMARQ